MFKLKRKTRIAVYDTLVHLRTRVILLFSVPKISNRTTARSAAVFLLLSLPLFFLTRVPTPAYAATTDNLNFQARLQTGAGSIAPDGYYNVEFKLYDASTAGTLLWTSAYDYNGGAPDQRVRVANGYLTVNLGDLDAFPGTMPWDQQLYLTMNIGGTGTVASWDGEMDPRLKLTAVPYAFNAKTASQLQTSNGANNATLSIQSPTVGSQTFVIQDQGAAGTYNILTEAEINAGYIQLQGTTPGTAQTGNFNITGTGIAASLQATTGITSVSLTATGQSTLGGGSNQVQVIVKGNASQSTSLIQFQNSGGDTLSSIDANGQLKLGRIAASGTTQAGTVTFADGTNSNFGATLGVETLTADRKFLLPDTTLATTASPGTICVFNGSDSNCPAATGSAYYIQNQTASAQTSASYWIDGTARADSGFIGSSFDTASAGVITIGSTNATNIQIGSNTTDATAHLFILDSYNGGTDPTGYAGAMYYSTNTNTFRCYENGAWGDCSGGASGVGTVGAIDTQTKSANGAVISGTSIYLQTADGSAPGLVSITGQTFAGTKTFSDGIVIAASQSITITGGNTASRPVSPTEGMVYFDTTTKQLLTYSNGKWQSDSKTATFIVAATNSSQTAKDGAQYVADGEDSAGAGIGTLDGDQVQINNALTAAAAAGGGTVYLSAGTYTVDGSISIPNNVTLAGSGASSIIQFGNFGATATSIDMIVNTDTTTGTGIVIRDLKIDGRKTSNTSGTTRGIYLNQMGDGTGATARKGALVTNVWAKSFRNEAVYLTNSENNTITNSHFVDNNSYNIRLNTSSLSNTISDNNIQAGTYGVSIESSSDSNTVTGNTIQNTTTSAVYMSGSVNTTVSNNNIVSGGTNSINVSTSANYTSVVGNTISQAAGAIGISLNTASYATVTGNLIHDGATGIYISLSGNDTITGNTIRSTTTRAIYANNASPANIVGNTLDSNTIGIELGSTGSNMNITGNTITNSGGATDNNAIKLTSADNNIITSNQIRDTSCTTTCYAINITDAGSDTNYLADNTLDTGSINDAGTGTIYGGQLNSAGNYRIQPAGTIELQKNTNVTGTLAASVALQAPLVDTATAVALNIGTTNATSVTIGKSTITTNLSSDIITVGSSTSATIIQGSTQTVSNTTGENLTIKGSAGDGTGNGGTLNLSGGAAGGGGSSVIGLVGLNPTAFNSIAIQNLGTTQTLTQSWVDSYSTIPLNATVAGLTFTIPAPTISSLGRVLYISNAGSTNDFSVVLAGTSVTLTLKPNSTATLIWNGNGWTAAGASSSTDLQSAYNNTLTSAGGAELVLNGPGGNADGFTIRNNAATPITGGILEVQSSIGTNLFGVNNQGTELAANGGAETSGTFGTDWTAAPTGGVITRNTTTGEYVTGQAGVQIVTAAVANQGVRNNLVGNPVVSTTYTVSFAAKSSTAGAPLDIQYSPDGGTSIVSCADYGTTPILDSALWTKVTCTITTTGTAVTNPDLIIRLTDSTPRTVYLDNLSFVRNDTTTQPSNVQIGGGITGGQVTLFTLDRSSSPPVADGNSTYLGSMYYDTVTGRIQCYEADGWGACGSAPDNIVILTPEYSNAVLAAPGVLGGTSTATGVGTLTADFCSNQSGVLEVNTSFCVSGVSRNYYRWTSPQPTSQTYSIYVSYTLPSTFKNFYADDTIKLTGLRDSSSNSNANLSVLKSTGSAITQCGSTTQITTSTNAWDTTTLTGNETSCGFAAGDIIIFKIDVSANSNANVYIENLQFRYTNQ